MFQEIADAARAKKAEGLKARITHDFAYHAPTGNKVKTHERVRNLLRDAALELATLVPEGRELSTALSKLEEAMVWANAGVARNPEVSTAVSAKTASSIEAVLDTLKPAPHTD